MLKINLLDNHYRDLVSRQEKARVFNRISLVIFGIVMVGLVSVGFVKNYYTKKLEAVREQIASGELALRDLETVRRDSVIVSKKLDLIEGILLGREVLGNKLALFFKLFTNESIDLREVGFGDTTSREQLEVGASSENVAHFIDFTQEMENYIGDDNLEAVLLKTLSRDESGEYRFTYIIDFPTNRSSFEGNSDKKQV